MRLLEKFIRWYNEDERVFTLVSNKEKVWIVLMIIGLTVYNVWCACQ